VTVHGSRVVDLPGLLGSTLDRRPWVHRILAENLLRHRDVDPDAAQATARWLEQDDRSAELPFRPSRLLMHDTTCGPALVDLAAMRSVVAAAGTDPGRVSTQLQIDVSTDHSVAVDHHGDPASFAANLALEMTRNAERFALMKWASHAFESLQVHAPGTGIMHTINLERLATVVTSTAWQGQSWTFPDTLVGTDSHTPMINGIGVLGWGVGGLEAESVMLGMPVMLRVPEVVGVRLAGRLRSGVTATDLALTVTQRLREIDVGGRFVEFFGPGVAALSAGTRAAVANMAPEFGGATGYFPIDGRTIEYLRATGRENDHVAGVERYVRQQQLWFDPQARPEYDRLVELDLDTVRPSLAGPRRPQDRIDRSAAPALARDDRQPRPIAIAAITSCTNTSDARLLVAAGLFARNAVERGLRVPRWVKTSLAPGSPTARIVLQRAGVLGALERLGFAIVAHGCTTCIGNSGPLTAVMETMVASGASPVAVLSGNRNFPGRVHRRITEAYLASPPLVVAYALAGDFDRRIETEPVGHSPTGQAVYLHELWPADDEVDAVVALVGRPTDVATAYDCAESNSSWAALAAPTGPLYPWNPASTYLRPPPFATVDAPTRLGRYTAHPLLVLGDDVTTDHISPAGAIPAASEAGRWLVERGEDPTDLNVYAARRGNWEVMVRGLYTNPTVHNLLQPGLAPGTTLHVPSGEVLPLWDAAGLYAQQGDTLVVVAGERYGAGSSRDWAAKGLHLLGVRAVLACSFERIHRSNLCNMGILPLELPAGVSPATLQIAPGDRFEIDVPVATFAPSSACPVTVRRADGATQRFVAKAAVATLAEVDVLRAGGLLPLMLRRCLSLTGS
jgi:aconitate hydratase